MTGIEQLVRQFANDVVAQTEATKIGDATTGNRHAKRVDAAFRALCKFGDAGRDALVPLMLEERVDVRAAAAAYLLRYKHDMASVVLREISRGVGFFGFSARETLKRWNEGAWQLDVVDEGQQS